MTDELLGVAVFVGYGIVVSLALVLAVVVFRTGDGNRDRPRSWWRRWR